MTPDEVAVIVSVIVPRCVRPDVEMVRVELDAAGFGLKEAVVAFGRPLTVRLAVVLTLTPYVVEAPCVTVWLVGVAVTVSVAAATVSATCVECVAVEPLPVIVSVSDERGSAFKRRAGSGLMTGRESRRAGRSRRFYSRIAVGSFVSERGFRDIDSSSDHFDDCVSVLLTYDLFDVGLDVCREHDERARVLPNFVVGVWRDLEQVDAAVVGAFAGDRKWSHQFPEGIVQCGDPFVDSAEH